MTRQEKDNIGWLLVWFVFAVMATIASKATTDIRGPLIAVCASSAAAIATGRGYTTKAKKTTIILLIILVALHAGLYFFGKGYPHPLNLIPVAALFLAIYYAKQKEERIKLQEILREQERQGALEDQRIAREVKILCDINEEMLAHPGWFLEQHANDPEARFNILYGGYDYVILQEHAHPFGPEEVFLNAARTLNTWIRDAGAIPIIYETWAKKDEPHLQSHMNEVHRRVAAEIGKVNRALNYGAGGYHLVLSRMNKN